MQNKNNLVGYLFIAPYLIVCFLLYLVIFHVNLFSWVNIELLKSVTPDIFIPIKRANGLLYNEAILAGAVSFISVFVLIVYYLLLLKKLYTKERLDNFFNQVEYIKVFFAFIVSLTLAIGYFAKIHYSSPSNLQVKQFITSNSQRYLFVDFAVWNMSYALVGLFLFFVISPFFFNAKKEK